MTRDRATLGELVACCGGAVRTGPFGSQLHKHDYVEDVDATPVIMPKDMSEGRVDASSIARVDGNTIERLKHHVVESGDIVLARRGEIGRRAWIGDRETGWLCGTGSMRISLPDCPRVRSRYLYYYLATERAVGWLEGHSVGATMSNLSAGVVEELPVEFPPVEVQDKIVGVLDSIGSLTDVNRRRIEVVEEVARRVYREWFVHFRFPGHEDVELADSDLGPIPETWDVAPASIAFEVNPRERLHKGAQYKFLTMGDLSETGMVCWPSEVKAGTSGAKFRNGDTLFARITPCLENGKTGFVACLDDGEIGRGSTEFIVLRGAEVGPEFTYLTARDESFRQNAIKSMTGASGRQRVRNECFDNYLLVVPTIEVEMAFREAVRPMFELVFSLAHQNQVLAGARDLLLPRLISGELDVADLDLDLEPVA
jgi:type I restriction enzyme, S subunit